MSSSAAMPTSATAIPSGMAFACQEAEVPRDGTVLVRSVGVRSVAIARRALDDDTLVAFDSLCPHMRAPLGFGRVVHGEIVCPWHFMRFDAVDGSTAGCNDTVMRLRTYTVQVVEGNVYVDTRD